MDETTVAVKEMYEKYPYPSGVPTIRCGVDVNLLLSYVHLARKNKGTLNVLDAGCGRGLGLISAAMLQPNINFIGVDINTTALKDARESAKSRGLTNITFVVADLMTLEGLAVPKGGFDVIYSSGVLHHLSKPLIGLQNLNNVLAPHGVISFMVYGRYGRQALYRLIESIDLLHPEEKKIEDKLPLARLMSQVATKGIFKGNYWDKTADTDDVEFVDRCLNVNEVSYDIDELWELFEQADMKFIRWDDPEEWSILNLFDNEALIQQLKKQTPKDQFKIIERMFERPKLSLILSKNTNAPRLPIPIELTPKLHFSVNPEVSFAVEKRNLDGFQRIETLSFTYKDKAAQTISHGLLGQAALMLVDQNSLFLGDEMIKLLINKGGTKLEASTVIMQLLALNIIYCPQ